MLEGLNVLVTGGAGFIGSNLVHYLCNRNHVIVLDNLILGKRENLPENRIEFIKGDIRCQEDLKRIKDVELVYHLAAIPGVQQSIDHPIETTDINVVGTLRMLEFARKHDAMFIFASTCAVYGRNMDLPLRENDPPDPLSPYATGKLACEYLVKNYKEIYGLEGCSFRFFNVYGPRQDPQSPYAAVVPRFIASCLRNEPPVIYGNGNQTRDFVYVMDVVRALVLAVEKNVDGVMNIGTGKEYSVLDLFDIVRRVTDYRGTVRFDAPRVGEVPRSRADITIIKNKLSWMPVYSLEDGIKETVEWFKRHPQRLN